MKTWQRWKRGQRKRRKHAEKRRLIASSRLTSSYLESVTCVEPVRITTDVGQTLRVAPEKFSMTMPLLRSGSGEILTWAHWRARLPRGTSRKLDRNCTSDTANQADRRHLGFVVSILRSATVKDRAWRFGKNLTKMEKKTKEKKKPCREVKISWVEGLRDLSFVFKHSYPPHCSCLHLTMCSPQNHWLILWPPRQPGWSPCRRSPHQAVLEKLTPSLLQTTTLKMFQSKKIDN